MAKFFTSYSDFIVYGFHVAHPICFLIPAHMFSLFYIFSWPLPMMTGWPRDLCYHTDLTSEDR